MNTSSEFDTDVVVVGSGPMGGTTALALATYGVRVHVVSKWNWVANTPRAHIINQRAVEVLRDLGVEEATKLEATPWDQMGDTLFTTSLGGPEVARLQTWGTGDDRFGDYLQGSPCTMLDVPQPLMEPVLITNAAKRGAKVSFNTEYLSHTQDADGVTVTLHNRISDTTFTQRARFLVGADGARSKIAEDIGLEISGELARAGTVYARFDADLSRVRRAPAEHPALDHEPGRRFRGDRDGPAPRRPAVGSVDRRVGFRPEERRTRPGPRPGAGEDPGPGRRPEPRGRHRVRRPLVREPGLRPDLFGRPGALRRGRRPPAPTEQRPGLQHLRAGRVQPGLETRLRHQRARRPGAARLLLPGAGPRRAADRATGQPVPGGLRPAARSVRHHRHRHW